MKKELRFCKVCFCEQVEDEVHFLLKCSKLKPARKAHVKPLLKRNPEYKAMNDFEKISWLISEPQMKEFGKILAIMYDARQEVLTKKDKK